MYAEDQHEVARWIAADPGERIVDAAMMVALSIQQPWSTVGEQLTDWRQLGMGSRFVWGMKQLTLDFLKHMGNERRFRLYQTLKRCVERGRIDRAHWIMLQVPGLGLTKGGFLLQLMFGVSGCFDSVNLARLGVNPNLVKSRKKLTTPTQTKRIRQYLALVAEHGGTAVLWDSWCQSVAERDASFEDAADVSRRHLTYLTGEWKEEELPL